MCLHTPRKGHLSWRRAFPKTTNQSPREGEEHLSHENKHDSSKIFATGLFRSFSKTLKEKMNESYRDSQRSLCWPWLHLFHQLPRGNTLWWSLLFQTQVVMDTDGERRRDGIITSFQTVQHWRPHFIWQRAKQQRTRRWQSDKESETNWERKRFILWKSFSPNYKKQYFPLTLAMTSIHDDRFHIIWIIHNNQDAVSGKTSWL